MKPHRLPVSCGALYRTVGTYGNAASSKYVNQAESGKDNFERDYEKSHVKTTLLQKFLLGVGSGIISITSPSRGDMIAVMGEVTGYQALEYIQSKMNESDEGRRILEEKPRISSGSIDLEKLKKYPEGTLGKAYSNFLQSHGFSPDTRNAVRFVDDVELAYVAQRYRESHDLFHTLLDMPTNMLGEVTVKWVEAIQTKLPMCAAGALFGSVRLAPKFSRTYCTKVVKVKTIVKLDEPLEQQIKEGVVKPKHHPGVMNLKNLELQENVEQTIQQILKRYDKKDLKMKAEHLRNIIKSRHLPVERVEKEIQRRELTKLLKEKYPRNEEYTELKINAILAKKMKAKLNNWQPIKYDMYKGLQYLIERGPADYAVVMRVLNEIHKRDKDFQPKTLLDFGSGVGTVSWAANNLWGETLREYYSVDASGDMHELAAMILRGGNMVDEPIIKHVYYRQFLAATPKPYDIVVSAYTFFELPSCLQRMKYLTRLWNNTKDYLVLIEVGSLAGFTVINEAREYLLSISKENNIKCYIFAPCPHENECPRYNEPGKKTPCNFSVDYKRLKMGVMHHPIGQERFCFLIMKKGEPPPANERQCRIVRDIINRGRLVVCRVCTNSGNLLQLNVSASKYGKPAFSCMKKSYWGDVVPGVLQDKVFEYERNRYIKKKESVAIPDVNAELISDSNIDSESSSKEIPDCNSQCSPDDSEAKCDESCNSTPEPISKSGSEDLTENK